MLYAGESTSVGCFHQSVGGSDFYTAAHACGFDDTVIELYNAEIH